MNGIQEIKGLSMRSKKLEMKTERKENYFPAVKEMEKDREDMTREDFESEFLERKKRPWNKQELVH